MGSLFFLIIVGIVLLFINPHIGCIYFSLIIILPIVLIVIRTIKKRSLERLQFDALEYGINFDGPMSGLDFEQGFAALLKRLGYRNIVVTNQSGDYGVDIIVNDGKGKSVFQCKWYSANVGVKAVQEAYAGKTHYKADKAYVVTNSYFTKNAITLAESTKVILWDRDELLGLINKAKRIEIPPEKDIKYKREKLHKGKDCKPMMSRASTIDFNDGCNRTMINMESNNAGEQQLNGHVLKPTKGVAPIKVQKKAIDENEGCDSLATILKAGRYIFGKNIPYGMYDLTVIKGGGWLTLYNNDNEEELSIYLGDKYDGTGATEYIGIDSDFINCFTLEDNIEVTIIKTQMIEIED